MLQTRRWSLVACLLLMGSINLGGCTTRNEPSAAGPPPTADNVVRQMIAAYRAARSYQDNGVVRLQYRRDGERYEDEAPLAVSWQAPNQLRVQAYQLDVACDGVQLLARINDESTRNFDGQVVVRDAPRQLTLRELWEEDEILSLAFRQGLAGYPFQLDLLLSKTPLAALMEEDVDRSLLEPATIDGNTCHRVRLATADGTFVLWVDKQCSVLRRIEFPAAKFAPEIVADRSVEDLQLTVECRAASFKNRPDAGSFALRLPADAKRVKRLIPLPRELPSDLFGKKTAPYAFMSLSGETVSEQSLGDRIKVLVWFNDHPACQSTIQQMNQVFRQYKSEERVAFQAVCAEAASFSNQQITALTQAWHVDLPVVRDPQAVGRDLFDVPWAPTVVVLDGNDVVQIYEVGANPNLVVELPQVLEQLLAGEDVAGVILDQFRQERARYERALERGEPELPANLAGADTVASSSSPQVLQLRPLWSSNELKATGNVMAVRDGQGATRFLVYEGWRTITEIGTQGNLLARHQLDLPPQAAVSQLQTATDASGTRCYVAWSMRSSQAHVFDSQWNRTLSYPPDDVEHEGVQDAMLGDLDGDGRLELHVGFWGAAGVHCVSLSGRRLWENLDVPHVLSLMQVESEEGRAKLWVSSASGQITRLDHHGRSEPIARHAGLLTHHLFRAALPGQATIPYCGISYGLEGRRLAFGLGPEADSQWRYNLPAGSFATQVRFVTSAPLLDDDASHWLLAGADGSLHIISNDGRFTDYFQTGKAIHGVAGGRQASAGILVVSSEDGLQAWQVSPPVTARVQQ